MSHNYSKTILGANKTDSNDAFALADFATSGKTNNLNIFKPNQYFAIQSLTRQRKHYVELMSSEKVRILNYIFILTMENIKVKLFLILLEQLLYKLF